MNRPPAKPDWVHFAILSIWILVFPGLMLAPHDPNVGMVRWLISVAFQAALVVATVSALYGLLLQLKRSPRVDPSSHARVVTTLDSIEATWAVGTPHRRSLLMLLFGLVLHGWILFGVVLGAREHALNPAVAVAFGGVVVAAAVPWVWQLLNESWRAKRFRIRATVDHVRVESAGELTELPMHGLVAHAPEHTLRLSSGETAWVGPCPDSPGRTELVSALQGMASRVGPSEAPDEPEALRQLRSLRTE